MGVDVVDLVGGNGIIVIRSVRNGRYFRANGTFLDEQGIEHHISNVLSGMYSLGGRPDQALIERCVEFDPIFDEVTFQGVPDIRTIVYRGFPVSAMVRLPTRRSDGKVHLVRVLAEFEDDGRCHVRSARAQGSHQLAATAMANAIAVVPDGDGIPAGAEVAIVMMQG